ncbi:MAG: transcriptional regulator CynR [Opitutus sp.]|nr:transcriptional regulator CynR [Opitutus sp.]
MLPSDFELRHLRYFLAVAELAHFTKAARQLHVTQPTLSHQIRQLEDRLGLPLFDRVGRQVRLTAAGQALRPYATRVLRELDGAQAELGELRGLKRGRLRVGVVQTVNACVVPDIVSRFTAAHPGIQVSCAELAVEDIESGLESGRLDLGVGFLPPGQAGLEGEKLFTEELVAVVSASHPLARRRVLRVAEIVREPLVLLAPRFCTRQLIDRAFAAAHVVPRVQLEMNSIESILATLRQAPLASILPALALCRRDIGVQAIALTQPTPRRSVGLLWRRGAHRPVAARAFADATTAILRERGVAR